VGPLATTPFVLTCEHATRALPVAVDLDARERAVLASHWGWDVGAWAVTRALATALGATALGGRVSRLWIDLNRDPTDPTLVRRDAGGVALRWNRRLGPAELERRIVTWHAPYHHELDRQIVRRLLRGVRPLVFAVHTFTPVLDGATRGFDIGVLFDEHARAGRRLARELARAGLAVRENEPYSGRAGLMYAAARHGRQHRLVCLELEVNQRCFESSRTVPRLARLLARALPALVESG
jgi:predicted N-formylglutamate amidohydrolase